MVDELNDGLHQLEAKGHASTALIQGRKEVRHMISQLVHQTDSKGGAERIPHILELGAILKQQIASEERR